jgi:hypothetical protein
MDLRTFQWVMGDLSTRAWQFACNRIVSFARGEVPVSDGLDNQMLSRAVWTLPCAALARVVEPRVWGEDLAALRANPGMDVFIRALVALTPPDMHTLGEVAWFLGTASNWQNVLGAFMEMVERLATTAGVEVPPRSHRDSFGVPRISDMVAPLQERDRASSSTERIPPRHAVALPQAMHNADRAKGAEGSPKSRIEMRCDGASNSGLAPIFRACTGRHQTFII